MNFCKSLLCPAALLCLCCPAPRASAGVIAQWTFENQPISGAPPYNNDPLPSTGSGFAIPIGMANSYGTPGPSVDASDILADPGSSDPASQQAWRVRGQGVSGSTANGWSSLAPEYTQGALFGALTSGYNNLQISFDWQPTNRGVEDIEVQYNSFYINPNSWINAGFFSNAVPGGVWNNGNSVTLPPSLSGTAFFAIQIVSAYHSGTSTYLDTTGAPLNNNSGNIRLDNVTISGTPVVAATPEPGTMMLLTTALAALVYCVNRRRLS